MNIQIGNEKLKIQIDPQGAQLKNISYMGTKILWNGDPRFWSGTAPILFPICGSVEDDKYSYDGHVYSMSKHGFARDKTFRVEEQSASHASFLLDSDADTRKIYPFDFELKVKFSIYGLRLDISYEVKNTGNEKMYYSIGAHEAYSCPEGIEDYDIIFPRNVTLDATILDGPLLSKDTKRILTDTNTLSLKSSFFEDDALVFESPGIESVELINRKTRFRVKVYFPDYPFLLLWTKPGAPFICIEPWQGLPDSTDSVGDFNDKKGIVHLDPGEIRKHIHSIEM